MNVKKSLLSTAMMTALGVSGMAAMNTASADSVAMSFNGVFTMVTGSGASALVNPDASSGAPYYGYRTAITGTMNFDLATGSGTGVVAPFSFFDGGDAVATSIVFQAIGDGAGGPGSLVLGNMGFNWSGNTGIPLSIVMDAAGMFGALQGGNPMAPPDVGNVTVSQTITGGATPASDSIVFGDPAGKFGTYLLPIGASPIATTTFNTTNIGAVTLGTNPSGTLPLTDDGIGGSPFQQAVPFNGFNANFDITSLHIDAITVTAIPVPAAVWLFGSGLLGLVGVARRRSV